MRRLLPLRSALFALLAAQLCAASPDPCARMAILVDGRAVPQYTARGNVYVEALKGKNYAIRLYNPFEVRVAVALSVDGLNTIDARRTSAKDARKWVLAPHETVIIPGWQTDMSHSRAFVFTSEPESYAQWLGKTENMGVITAVFFRERIARIEPMVAPPIELRNRPEAQGAAGASAGAAAKDSSRSEASAMPAAPESTMAAARHDEYAATGIGNKSDHPVRRIHMELEDQPATTVGVRYEFHSQLVRLGVLPPVRDLPDPLMRREGARGFEPGFCPEPPNRRW